MHHYFYPIVKSGWDRNRGVIQVATASVDKRLLKKGCSKTPRCKASEILRSETYLCVRRSDEG